MRCVIYYEPFGHTRQEQRQGRINRQAFLLNSGFAYDSTTFARTEMRDFVKHLRRQSWKVKGSMRKGYYEAFRGKKHRLILLCAVD